MVFLEDFEEGEASESGGAAYPDPPQTTHHQDEDPDGKDPNAKDKRPRVSQPSTPKISVFDSFGGTSTQPSGNAQKQNKQATSAITKSEAVMNEAAQLLEFFDDDPGIFKVTDARCVIMIMTMIDSLID